MREMLELGHLDNRKALYREMLRIRLVEEAIAERYVHQEMRCPTHLSIGQEAAAVGVCAALEREDYVFSTHRPHAHYLAKGGNLNAMIAELHGKATGCSAGRGGSMHLVDLDVNMLGSTPIVGGSLPVAVGVAFASWMRDDGRVTAVFLGDGATEEGVFLESIGFAALKELPIIFVCENNHFSTNSPMSVRQAAKRDRAGIAKASGLACDADDGNDVVAVNVAARRAILRARSGGGPSYLEFETYRWREHCGPNYDNDLGYRSEEDLESWRKRCPVASLQRELLERGMLTPNDVLECEREIAAEIDAAFEFSQRSPLPKISELSRVYSEPLQ